MTVGVFTVYWASRPTIAVVGKVQQTGRELYGTVTAVGEASSRARQPL